MSFFKRLKYYGSSVFRMAFGFKNFFPLIPYFLNKDKDNEVFVALRKDPLCLVARGAMDIWSIKETFLDAFYTGYGVPIRDGWTVMDIGAGIGDFSIYAAHENPHGTIFAFEPFPESFDLLKRNIALNGIENVLPFQSAVWGQAGFLHLDNSSGEPLQVVSKESSSSKIEKGVIKVSALPLSQVFETRAIRKLDLLKLDCEGAEYAILMGSSPDVFDKIERIIMEYHDIDEKHHHNRLASFLRPLGYKVSCYDNFVHVNIGYLFAERKHGD